MSTSDVLGQPIVIFIVAATCLVIVVAIIRESLRKRTTQIDLKKPENIILVAQAESSRVLGLASLEADRAIALAKVEADNLMFTATDAAAKLLVIAKAKADELIRTAKKEADALVAKQTAAIISEVVTKSTTVVTKTGAVENNK